MARYLVQVESGAWYQVDTDEPRVLRWDEPGIRKPDGKWHDLGVRTILIPPIPGAEMHMMDMAYALITTKPVISRELVENISKRRAVPTVAKNIGRVMFL